MKIRTKILAGFMVTTLVVLILGIAGVASNSKLESISSELYALQIENDGISKVLNAHYVWRQNLTESVLFGKEFTGSFDPGTCSLGQWLHSEEAKNISDTEVLSLIDKLGAPHDFIHYEAKNTAALIKNGDSVAARRHLENTIYPKTAEVISILTEMESYYLELVEDKDDESAAIARAMRLLNVILIAFGVVVSVVLAFIISGMISKPIVPISAFFNRTAETGDLTVGQAERDTIKKYSSRQDEIGQLTRATSAFVGRVVNVSDSLEIVSGGDLTHGLALLSEKDTIGISLKHMLDNLNKMFLEMRRSIAMSASSSKQIADGAHLLAQSSTEQAVSMEELSSSVSDISENTKASAELAEKAADLADVIITCAEKGTRQMDEMMSAVQEINQASQNISKVIKVIDDIAFQTNILALNAAVEAARAGQHGKGFAVVAEEVRNLASKSAQAAKETGAMIENSMQKAALGVNIAGDTAASFTEIVSGINESSELIRQIAKTSDMQSSDIGQINTSIDHVSTIVQQNSATAEESAAASTELSVHAAMLEEAISQYKINNSDY